MERSTTAVAVWLRVLLLAAPLHASLIAPSVQLQGGAPARSAAATQRRGAGLHTFCMRAIGVDSEASLDGLDSLDEDSHVRLTGDPAADAMIRRKMGIPAPKSSKSKLSNCCSGARNRQTSPHSLSAATASKSIGHQPCDGEGAD